MTIMTQLCGLLVCLFIGALGLAIIIKIFTGDIDLRYLVSETNHDASMSRFQLLIFTFVVAIALFRLVELNGKFPDVPSGVLTLLGISASTYAVGKGISYSRPEGVNPPPEDSGDGDGGDGKGSGSTAIHAAAARESAIQAAAHAAEAKQAAAQSASGAAKVEQAIDRADAI